MAVKPGKRKASPAREARRNATDGFFTVHLKQVKASFSALWHRPLGNILTLAVISMALAMPACLYLLSKNVALVASKVTSPSHISIYMREGVPEPRVMVLKDEIEVRSDVKSVDYVSPQQGLSELSQYSGFEKAISVLDDYALPGVLVVTPNVSDQDSIKAIARDLQTEQDVTDVRMDEDWLDRLDAIRHLAGILVVSLSVLMLAAVFLIVGNTLRFNVEANKDEIQTMKLIGATDSYILRPYLYSGMWFGLLGGAIAWLVTLIITLVAEKAVACC